MGGVPSVVVFLRNPSPYLRESSYVEEDLLVSNPHPLHRKVIIIKLFAQVFRTLYEFYYCTEILKYVYSIAFEMARFELMRSTAKGPG